MKLKRTTISSIICAAFGVSGTMLPAAFAMAEDAHAMQQATQTAQAAVAVDADSLPMTKNVVSRAAMDAMDTQDGYADAIANVAGVASNNAKGSAADSVKIRGIQLNLFTDYRLNGGLPITGVMSFPTEDKERIEALKGANALMFGIASPAGIINLVTKHAGEKDVSAAAVSGNGFGQHGASVDLGRRFGDEKQFGLRTNLQVVHLENGIDGASGSGQFASVAADWKASRDLKFMLDLEQYRKDVVEQGAISLSPVDPKTGLIPVPRIPDPRNLLSGTWDVYHPRTQNTQLRTEYALARAWKLSAEISRSHSERTRLQDRIDIGTNLDTGIGNNTVAYIDNKYTTDFYKIEALGKFRLWDMPHNLTLGASYTKKDAESFTLTNIQPKGQKQNIYNPLTLAAPVVPNVPVVYSPFVSKNTGVYFYDTVGIGTKWKLLAGLRETSSTFESSKGVTEGKTPSPALGALYDIAPATTIYASYMKGLEEGPTAPTNAQTRNPGEILPPAVSKQAEIGIRTSYFKGVSVNASAFDIDRPKGDTDPVSGIFGYNGTIRYRGIETTINADINRQWSLDFSGQVMRAVQHTPLPDTDNRTPENTAKIIAKASVKYKVRQVAGLTLNAGASFVGQRYINNMEQGTIPGVTLFNAGVGYATKIAGRKASFQVSIDNIANKRYWNSVATGTYGAGMDRSIKFSAKFDF